MKVERTTPKPAGRAGDADRSPDPVADEARAFDIPEAELTPRVQQAIDGLLGEIESLHEELNLARKRVEDLERSADQDQLLPILNRRAFVRELTRAIAFAQRYTTPTSLIYFDLNGFKKLNDTSGHAAGDMALAHFTGILLSNIRETDRIGRLGGDEFGVLLSHVDEIQAHKKADQLAEMLSASPMPWEGKYIPVSFAYGALQLRADDTADLAMARADEAMYAHKTALRNKT